MTLIDNVKQRANAEMDSQKSRATDTLGVIANAVRGTTTQLRNDQHDVVAQYIETAANQLDRVSTTLRNKDVNTLMADARQLARRQPALFIGGSFVLGLLAARFLKSSSRGDREWTREYGSDDEASSAGLYRGTTATEGRYPASTGTTGAYGSSTTTPSTTSTGQR